MGFLREFINKNPWLGWVLAIAFLVLSFILYTRLSGANDPYSVERLSEQVTLRDIETGEEWTMNRGKMEMILRERPDYVNPMQGLPNPKTGKLTGFPVDREWEETVARLNRERKEIIERRGQAPPPPQTPPQ